jgi:hypothetical protein
MDENESERPGPSRGHGKSVTEMSVDLTMAWLRRVGSTSDGREPKEVVSAMDEFFAAIQRMRDTETEHESRQHAVEQPQHSQPVHEEHAYQPV